MTIFVTSLSGSESLASFTNRFFHFSRSPGFRMTFDAAKTNGSFCCIQCQRSKESSNKRKEKRQVFLCRRIVRVKVKGKLIPTSFLKIKECSLGRKTAEKEMLVQLVGDQNPGSEAFTRSQTGRERREQKKCQGRSDCQRIDVKE